MGVGGGINPKGDGAELCMRKPGTRVAVGCGCGCGSAGSACGAPAPCGTLRLTGADLLWGMAVSTWTGSQQVQ